MRGGCALSSATPATFHPEALARSGQRSACLLLCCAACYPVTEQSVRACPCGGALVCGVAEQVDNRCGDCLLLHTTARTLTFFAASQRSVPNCALLTLSLLPAAMEELHSTCDSAAEALLFPPMRCNANPSPSRVRPSPSPPPPPPTPLLVQYTRNMRVQQLSPFEVDVLGPLFRNVGEKVKHKIEVRVWRHTACAARGSCGCQQQALLPCVC